MSFARSAAPPAASSSPTTFHSSPLTSPPAGGGVIPPALLALVFEMDREEEMLQQQKLMDATKKRQAANNNNNNNNNRKSLSSPGKDHRKKRHQYDGITTTTADGDDHRVDIDEDDVDQKQKQQQQVVVPSFLAWYTLFVESLSWLGLEDLINAQLTCRHVALMMAQSNTFQNKFFSNQPFRRFFAPSAKGSAIWTENEKLGIKTLHGLRTEDEDLRAMLSAGSDSSSAAAAVEKSNGEASSVVPSAEAASSSSSSSPGDVNQNDSQQQPAQEEEAEQSTPTPTKTSPSPTTKAEQQQQQSRLFQLFGRPDPRLSWKCIARVYERQTQSVACRAATPNYFRGVWRIAERELWKKTHLFTIESPPFFMKPSEKRHRFWTLRQSKIPPVTQQQFQLVVQRTTRSGGNALGCFIQAATPIEGREHEILFSLATLDRSLHPSAEYNTLRRFQGSAKLTTAHANTGFVFAPNRITRHVSSITRVDDSELGWDSPEDIVVEIELFSLGPGVTEADQILQYAPEIAAVLNLDEKENEEEEKHQDDDDDGKTKKKSSATTKVGVTSNMRAAIWRMLRSLTHSDPYQENVMTRRKALLRALLPALIRDLGSSDIELVFQVTGVLWNLTDVDVPPISRPDVDKIVELLCDRVKNHMVKGDPDTMTTEELSRQRRMYRIVAPAILGCLWNIPQSFDGSLALFGKAPEVSLKMFVKIIQEEVDKEKEHQRQVEEEQEQEQNGTTTARTEEELEARAARRKANAPIAGLLFACCHFVSRALMYLDRIKKVRTVLDEQNAEQTLQDGVSCLRRVTKSMAALGVALFSRDYAMFFVPMLGSRKSDGCSMLASFAFDCGYFLPATSSSSGGNGDDEE